jgi:TolB-like protein
MYMSDPGARVLYEFHDFRVDPQQRLLLAAATGEAVPLTPRAFDTLLYFIEHPGQLLDKAVLMKAIWPNLVVEENNLNQSISTLRRVLKENPGEHRFIVTEPGRGYRFVAPVTMIAIPPEARRLPPDNKADRAQASPAGASGAARSIAVLPFANLTRDPDKEYFSDGMAEELIHQLGRVPGLKVPSRTSVFAYRGRAIDVRQIARELDVEAVLEGSVRSAGERVRVTAQLIDGRSGFQLWTQSYDRQFGDLFKLQDELAAAILGALDIDSKEAAGQLAPPTDDVEAYHLDLQARAIFFSTPGRIEVLADLLGRALARDPGFARAYSALAVCHMHQVIIGRVRREGQEAAERAARRAVELDPRLGEAQGVLAQLCTLQARWLEAEEKFLAALKSEPTDLMIRNIYAIFLGATGRLTAGRRQASFGHRSAPQNPFMSMAAAAWPSLAGDDAEALRFANLAIALGGSPDVQPLPMVFANAALRAGRTGEAAAHIVRTVPADVAAENPAELIGRILAGATDAGQRSGALEALRDLRSRAPGPQGMDSPLMTLLTAQWYTMLGDLDAAYDVASRNLERFLDEGLIGIVWGGLWAPEMLPFRSDPRFMTFVRRLGLVDYWRHSGAPDGYDLEDGVLKPRTPNRQQAEPA